MIMSCDVQAQIVNNGVDFYIGDGGVFYTGSGNFDLGSGVLTTSRTSSSFGRVVFDSSVALIGASGTVYIDGYGSVLGQGTFLLPLGQSSKYAPINVVSSSSSGVQAAYFNAAPINSLSLNSGIVALLSQGYWDIQGTATSITLTWSESSINSLVSDLSTLTIVGYDGQNWVEIPSEIDSVSLLGGSSTINSGSIHSIGQISLSSYSAFTLAGKGINACGTVVTSSGNTKTWDGSSWQGGAPSLSDAVVINAPYHNGSFSCYNLILNDDVTLDDNQYVDVVFGVSGSGKFVLSSESNFVQYDKTASPPRIELTKRTRDVMRRFDYVYWGTPIAGNFYTQIDGAQASTGNSAGAFDNKFKYVSGSGGGWQPLTTTEIGRGFITRVKNQDPFINSTNTDYINLKFTGVANNGDITVPITNNSAFPDGGTSHVLLANPYPSAIDIDKFLTDNSSVDGAVYLWTSATGHDTPGQEYTQADYLVYTRTGVVMPNNVSGTFTGKIASGQGFKVKSLTNNGTVTFTNCMRLKNGNNEFFKNNSNSNLNDTDKFKISMTGNNGVYSQILIGYLPQATLDYDRLYDAGRNSVSTAQLYSIFPTDGRKLAINTRPSFFDTDVVPLGVSKSTNTLETFSFNILERQGIFASNNVQVFIHDKDQNVYHNLLEGPYTFSTNSTLLNNRFEIVYQDNNLGVSSHDIEVVSVYVNNQALFVSTKNAINTIQIYEITGKKLQEFKNIGKENAEFPFSYPQAVYFAKIFFENGKSSVVKIIKS